MAHDNRNACFAVFSMIVITCVIAVCLCTGLSLFVASVNAVDTGKQNDMLLLPQSCTPNKLCFVIDLTISLVGLVIGCFIGIFLLLGFILCIALCITETLGKLCHCECNDSFLTSFVISTFVVIFTSSIIFWAILEKNPYFLSATCKPHWLCLLIDSVIIHIIGILVFALFVLVLLGIVGVPTGLTIGCLTCCFCVINYCSQSPEVKEKDMDLEGTVIEMQPIPIFTNQ